MSYPKQLFRTLEMESIQEDLMKNLNERDGHPRDKWLQMRNVFTIQHIEVIRRRNKMSSPCNIEWYMDDDHILKGQQNPTKIPRVNIIDDNILSKHPPPCDEIQYVAYQSRKVTYKVVYLDMAYIIFFS